MTRTIEEYILSYGVLGEAARRDVEAYVANHPHYAGVLEEARALFEEIQSAPPRPSDADMADRLIDALFDQVKPDHDTLLETIAASPALSARYRELADRLQRLTAPVDPVARFEQLSGHSLADLAADREEQARRDRAPLQRAGRFLRRRGIVLATVAVVCLLVGIPSARLRAIDRLAYMPASELDLDGYDTIVRGEALPDGDIPADLAYRYALASFKHARSSGFGLFPRYDADALDRSAALLKRVIQDASSTSFLGQEARFALAKVYLAGSDASDARPLLVEVAAGDSHRATEAAELLARLRD
ncbi:MAG: hypothetical protein R2834_09470 [Rhodothermales bacterium]